MLKFSKKGIFLFLIIFIVLIAAGGVSYYFYDQYRKSQELLQNPNAAAIEEVNTLVTEVGRILDLPEGETPTIATVSDKEALSDQEFFSKAENGDKVLIYTEAKTAILYRPSSKKVINVAPVNIGTESAGQSEPANVAIYNGTTSPGLTNTAETELTGTVNNINVIAKENSEFKEYENTIVVAVADGMDGIAGNIAEALGGEVGDLPDTETAPDNADILIILGTDYVER